MQLTLGPNTMVHHHYKKECKHPGMISPAEINSILAKHQNPCTPWLRSQ